MLHRNFRTGRICNLRPKQLINQHLDASQTLAYLIWHAYIRTHILKTHKHHRIMKQKSITVLFAATLFLLGLAGTAKAQGHCSPWRAEWDSCILDKGYGHYRPHIPAGPYDYANEIPMRIYEDCPVHVDSLFYIRPGTKRTLKVDAHWLLDENFHMSSSFIPGLPKDHLGRHYLTNTETGKPFSEFDEIELPASDDDTYFPISFVHHPLTEGDPVYKDGYGVEISFIATIDGVEQPFNGILRYQYFQKPTVTGFSYQRPGPGFAGQFTMTFQGELVEPENRVGYDPKYLSILQQKPETGPISRSTLRALTTAWTMARHGAKPRTRPSTSPSRRWRTCRRWST